MPNPEKTFKPIQSIHIKRIEVDSRYAEEGHNFVTILLPSNTEKQPRVIDYVVNQNGKLVEFWCYISSGEKNTSGFGIVQNHKPSDVRFSARFSFNVEHSRKVRFESTQGDFQIGAYFPEFADVRSVDELSNAIQMLYEKHTKTTV